jgi:hypothetical protein
MAPKNGTRWARSIHFFAYSHPPVRPASGAIVLIEFLPQRHW